MGYNRILRLIEPKRKSYASLLFYSSFLQNLRKSLNFSILYLLYLNHLFFTLSKPLFFWTPMKLKISGYIDNLRRFILIFELVDVREEVCGETFTKKCYISFRNIILEKRKEDFSTYVILISDSPYSSRND